MINVQNLQTQRSMFSIFIEIPAFVAYENPSNFNESNKEDEETAPNFEKYSLFSWDGYLSF